MPGRCGKMAPLFKPLEAYVEKCHVTAPWGWGSHWWLGKASKSWPRSWTAP